MSYIYECAVRTAKTFSEWFCLDRSDFFCNRWQVNVYMLHKVWGDRWGLNGIHSLCKVGFDCTACVADKNPVYFKPQSCFPVLLPVHSLYVCIRMLGTALFIKWGWYIWLHLVVVVVQVLDMVLAYSTGVDVLTIEQHHCRMYLYHSFPLHWASLCTLFQCIEVIECLGDLTYSAVGINM